MELPVLGTRPHLGQYLLWAHPLMSGCPGAEDIEEVARPWEEAQSMSDDPSVSFTPRSITFGSWDRCLCGHLCPDLGA